MEDELVDAQRRLAREASMALAERPWSMAADLLVGGCFVAFARGEAGPGQPGDRAWAAAVAWWAGSAPVRRRDGAPYRRSDRALVGTQRHQSPRQASDIVAQAVVAGRAPAAYSPGLLALREGPLLAAAVAGLDLVPDVLLVDATGLDHPRRAGLAVHLGKVTGLPTVGVTQRTLCARGEAPSSRRRGASSPVVLDSDVVGYWVCTRTGANPVLAHAAWRTDAATAGAVVLAASTEGARAPVPLQEARRAAREARDLAAAGAG